MSASICNHDVNSCPHIHHLMCHSKSGIFVDCGDISCTLKGARLVKSEVQHGNFHGWRYNTADSDKAFIEQYEKHRRNQFPIQLPISTSPLVLQTPAAPLDISLMPPLDSGSTLPPKKNKPNTQKPRGIVAGSTQSPSQNSANSGQPANSPNIPPAQYNVKINSRCVMSVPNKITGGHKAPKTILNHKYHTIACGEFAEFERTYLVGNNRYTHRFCDDCHKTYMSKRQVTQIESPRDEIARLNAFIDALQAKNNKLKEDNGILIRSMGQLQATLDELRPPKPFTAPTTQ